MNSFGTLLRLQIKLMTTGDRLLYFYLISVLSFVLFKFFSLPLLWQIFLAISNVYLVLLYNRDSDLTTFYCILNVNRFKIHAVKIFIIYQLSLVQLVLLLVAGNESPSLLIVVVHFLSFYASLTFSRMSAWLKLVSFICCFVTISLILRTTPVVISSTVIFGILSVVIILQYNEQSTCQKPDFIR